MTESNPTFSVILPSHNGAERIVIALESVRAQTYKDYELIVLCDACDDDTAEIARHFGAKVIETDFRRDGLARNAGLDVARGDWILFLDDDDWFLHEYCFEMLADIVGKHGEDVLDYSFIWKGAGYKRGSLDEQFVMVWCRAWKRTFIGDNRFSDAPYGSDREFYKRMLYDRHGENTYFWDQPMYYYNYMREGSLSWMESRKTYLDMIVTHYDEPWELGKPLFDMLQHQRCANIGNVSVTLVQDGEDNALDWDELFRQYSFPVNVITVRYHAGVSYARNSGLDSTSAPWVMFCNFDDRLGDVASLSMMLQNFPTDDYDLVWSKMVQEMHWFTGAVYLNCIDGNSFATVAGKMYRRKVLDDNHIRFDVKSLYYYDHIFNSLVLAYVEPFRIAALTTNFYPYFKTFRADSTRHTKEAFLYGMRNAVRRDMRISELLDERGFEYEATRTAAKALFREYYAIYNPDNLDNSVTLPHSEFVRFYADHIDAINSLPEAEMDPIKSEAEVEVMNIIQEMYNEHKKEYYLMNDDVEFEDWLPKAMKAMEACTADNSAEEPAQSEEAPEDAHDMPPVNEDLRNQRVVVYCGTYDVYLNMIASLKSLLCNVPVDKVYFLCEDDVFPYALPDIVETINVKNQTFFPPDGPNFDNSWTYMCMMRAIYPRLFSMYDKILSLDIDIVINDNVSDLWDYDISDYYLAGVPERQRQKSSKDPVYINFGVVMMNLDKLRQDNKQDEIVDILNNTKVGCPEQDAYNRACAGQILPLPADYNYTTYSHITGDAIKQRIIHYAGQKFWRHYKLVKQYSDLEWSEVMSRQQKLKEG